MCLVTQQSEIKVADKDIVCYKVVQQNNLSKHKNIFKAIFRTYDYTIGEKCTIGKKLKIEDYLFGEHIRYDGIVDKKYEDIPQDVPLFAVSEGFHSMTSKKRAQECFEKYRKDYYFCYNNHNDFDDFYILKCIIPKGSEFLEDATDLIVSNQINIISVFNQKPRK